VPCEASRSRRRVHVTDVQPAVRELRGHARQVGGRGDRGAPRRRERTFAPRRLLRPGGASRRGSTGTLSRRMRGSADAPRGLRWRSSETSLDPPLGTPAASPGRARIARSRTPSGTFQTHPRRGAGGGRGTARAGPREHPRGDASRTSRGRRSRAPRRVPPGPRGRPLSTPRRSLADPRASCPDRPGRSGLCDTAGPRPGLPARAREHAVASPAGGPPGASRRTLPEG
jgi:hypothetical protein